jgi:hypothetical protein
VGFFGEPGVVPGSFAVPLGPVVLYGVVDDGAVVVCGLHLAPVTADAQAASAVLARIVRAHGLVLVDWCRAVTVTADDVPRHLVAALDPAGEPGP